MPLVLVFATSTDNLFGIDGELPWNCQQDMSYFKALTSYSNVVMGRKTADSIGKPLPNRRNLVLTSNKYEREGFEKTDLNMLESLWKTEDVFVIGGVEILKLFLTNYLDEIDLISHSIIDTSVYPIKSANGNKIYFNLNDYFNSNSKYYSNTYNIKYGLTINTHLFRYRPMSDFIPKLDSDYLKLGLKIINETPRITRNGVTRSSFSSDFIISHDFKNGFPILKSKTVWWKGVKEELDFFWDGKTDTKELEEKGIKIWSGNTSAEFLAKTGKDSYLREGEMGPMYGFQWRHFNADYRGDLSDGIDQIQNVIDLIVKDPYSRRILMTDYNPLQAEKGCLYPCHSIVIQFYVEEDNRISMKTYQRSADWFLGVPFNLSSNGYLLTKIVDEVNNRQDDTLYEPGVVTTIFGDAHLYESHVPIFFAQYVYNLFTDKLDFNNVELDDESKELKNYVPVKRFVAPMIA